MLHPNTLTVVIADVSQLSLIRGSSHYGRIAPTVMADGLLGQNENCRADPA
jgi:hypothetical protein